MSSAGDFNGDGYDDVIVGADYIDSSGLISEASYVVFGGNFTNAVTFLGTPGVDNFSAGAASSENVVAGDSNDWMIGGGADVFHGGAGDDIIKVSDSGFRSLDGGAGNDTLAVTGSGLNLNLVNVHGKIDGIEAIDLTGNGNNALTLTALDLLNLSDTSNTLKVNGNTGDVITGLSSGWTDGGITGDCHTYTLDAAVLLVGINVTTDFI